MADKTFKPDTILPVSPDYKGNLTITDPPTNSVGFKAIASSLNQMRKYMNWIEAVRLSFKINQKSGFDCPGCAWPDPDDDRSRLGEYCENGIKAIAEEASKNTIPLDFFEQFTIAEISHLSDFELGKLGRLSYPMIVEPGTNKYRPLSWEEAYKIISKVTNNLSSPDEAIFYTSGRTSNEAAYMYQLMVRRLGTNNLPDCSNMCHESSGVGLSETLGIGKGSVTLEDIHKAEVIMIMGQNPGTNHPRMLSALEKCKENGGKIITVNPIPEAGLIKYTNPQSPAKLLTGGIALTDLYAQVKINGDVAFLKAVMIKLYELEKQTPGKVFDHEFIDEHCTGYEDFILQLQSWDYEDCLEQCGITSDTVKQTAHMLAYTSKIIICWAMGLTQHENGVDNIKEIVNLLLLKGAIGKPGAGTCPVRGHSNVQGDRTMGIWEAAKDEFLDALEKEHGIKAPREHGYATVDAIKAMYEGRGKMFFAMGGNFVAATPDTLYTAKALQKCELTVQVSTKLNRSHLIHGRYGIILPCLGRTDIDMQASGPQKVSVENSMGVVHASEGILTPPSRHLKSETAIVCELANQLFKNDSIPWLRYRDNYDVIRDAIANTIEGFENYNQKLQNPGGFYLPNGARDRKFDTSSGKAVFSVVSLPRQELQEGEFILMTIRSHDQFNTTIYGMNDRYRGVHNGRRVVFMNIKDVDNHNLKKGDKVNLISIYKDGERRVDNFSVIPYSIPLGNAAAYFPETNPLVPNWKYARKSKTPCSKMIRIRIEKSVK